MAVMAALASLLLAAPAFAQEDGVFIDPDSPSAKEYRLPLESERRQADPGQEPAAAGIVQGERSAPILGAGIEGGGTGAKRGSRSKEKAARSSKPQKAAPDGDDAEILQAATSNPGPPAGGIGVALIIGGVAVGVLLRGGLAGLLLRRRA
jgi:hypothetical protein